MRVIVSVHGCAQVCTGVRRYAQVCMGLHRCAGVYKCSLLYAAIPGCMCSGVHVRAGVCVMNFENTFWRLDS